jgi:REP element-mobilizing transposase RayT
MPQPIVIAYHLIWTAYGTWLPNDPRGSGSTEVRGDLIAELGELHYGRKRVQPAGAEIRRFYKQAAKVLRYPLLTFNEAAREVIASAFGQTIEARRYTCYACAIMPDHIHLLIRKHRDQAEEMIAAFREASHAQLIATDHRPTDHPTWTDGHGWVVYLDHPDDIHRTIPYINRNPLPLGLPEQHWPFVTPYDGWPLHAGHNANSPFARRLRAARRH